MSGRQVSVSFGGEGKNMIIAYLLWFFLGGFGIHRFYLGKIGTGITQLALLAVGIVTSVILIGYVLLIALSIWWILDAYFVFKYVNEANAALPRSSSVLRMSTTDARSNDLDVLEKLHALHQSGALTDEEYRVRKERLLGNP